MRFQAKPFAVEVKRNRKSTQRPLLIDTAPQSATEPPPTAARALAESLFGSFTESSEPSSRTGQDRAERPPAGADAASPALATAVAEIAPARRILPDLRRDIAKVESEEEARAAAPVKAPRARRRAVAEFGLTSGDGAEPAARRAVPAKKPRVKAQRKLAATLAPIEPPPAMVKPAGKERGEAIARIRPQSTRVTRKAADGPVATGLRRGERWKRRLPRVLW